MKFTVIVVDDEYLIAKNIAKNIENVNSSYQVVQICSCGSDALNSVKELLPNVVFTDIRMPEMDGLELAKQLSLEFPFIKCVIVSGYNDFEYAKKAISYQVKDYILKPINKEELKDCLDLIEKDFFSQHPSLKTPSADGIKGWNAEKVVDLVKEYIHNNYEKPIDLTTISNNLGFSGAYLSKIFSVHAGISPSKYLKEYRIKIAKQLLSKESIPISEVSILCGFTDPFHFSKSFKSCTGYSPSDYRSQTLH